MARRFAIVGWLILALISPAAGQAAGKGPDQARWTIERILSIPQIEDLALSPADRSVAYVARRSDLALDRPDYALHFVTADGTSDRVVARSAWIGQLRTIPGKRRWSILADFGKGVQLYEIDARGAARAIVISPTSGRVGSADGARYGFIDTAPIDVGIVSYDWSPDGRRLFYATLSTAPAPRRPLTNEAVTAASIEGRWGPRQIVHFFMREGTSPPLPVATRPVDDLIARFFGALPTWGDAYLEYGTQADERNDPGVLRWRWSFRTHRSLPAPIRAVANSRGTIAGPHGGLLDMVRRDDGRHLIERLPDGGTVDYGRSDLSLSDPRSPGSWRAADGTFSLVAVRLPDRPRYALLRIGRDRTKTLIQVPESLTHCAFAANAIDGVCLREGLVRAPQLVRVSSATGMVTPLRSLPGPFARAAPLRAEPRSWTNSMGYKATGYLIYPRGYRAGQRYPAIIVTHAGDADERFGAADLQWNYPIQVFAEQGYAVALVNEPYSAQSKALEDASADWNACGDRMAPPELQRLVWLNMVETFRKVVQQLGSEGLIDEARVGIAGYSAGSQMANVAVTQSTLFKAASSGDGGFLEPAPYRYTQCSYRAVYGGPPSDPAAAPNYAALAPSYRARFAKTPLLQQIAEPRASKVDFFQALRAAGVPTEITLYPGESQASDETHLFHIPSNRRAAMIENLQWFDFWLRDMPPPAGRDATRRERWTAMRPSGDRPRAP